MDEVGGKTGYGIVGKDRIGRRCGIWWAENNALTRQVGGRSYAFRSWKDELGTVEVMLLVGKDDVEALGKGVLNAGSNFLCLI